MTDPGIPIAYGALEKGTAMLTRSGRQFGTVEHVLQIPEEDLFDGIVTATEQGLRFVDRDQIEEITSDPRAVRDHRREAAGFRPRDGEPVYTVNALQDAGGSLHDRLGRMFRRPRWTPEQ